MYIYLCIHHVVYAHPTRFAISCQPLNRGGVAEPGAVPCQKVRYCGYSNAINSPFLMVGIPPIKMMIRGMVYDIAIPT